MVITLLPSLFVPQETDMMEIYPKGNTIQGQTVNCLYWLTIRMHSCTLEITSRLQFGNTSWLSKRLQKICAMQTSI